MDPEESFFFIQDIFRKILDNPDFELSKARANNILNRIDIDGDNRIQKNELVEVAQKLYRRYETAEGTGITEI